MRLLELKIHGFGKWVDYTLKLTSGSPICLFGENESGKTTLQKFILFILFGLTPKQRVFYRPKTSSKMGGRLSLIHPDAGKIIIERLDGVRNGAAVCYTEDGLEHDEDWLKKQLNGMTERTFKSIYSFDAIDLTAIQNMEQEEIGEVLLAVGLTGSRRIHDLEKQLDAKLAELFKPYGTKPVINDQLTKLTHLEKSIQEHKHEADTYHEKTRNLQRLITKKEELITRLKRDKKLIDKLEKELQALPYIHEFKRLISQLEQLPKVDTFPKNGVDRLKILKENELPLQSELSILKADEKKYLKEKNILEKELEQPPNIEALKEILNLKPTYLYHQQEMNKLSDTMKSLDMEISTALNELNVGIQIDQLEAIQLPFHTEKTWIELKNAATQLKMENEQLTEEKQIILSKQSFLQNKLVESKKQQMPEIERNQLEKRIKIYNESEIYQQFNQDMTNRQTNWEKNKHLMKKRHRSILGGSMILTITFFTLFILMDHKIFANLAILSLVGGTAFMIWGRLSLNSLEELKPNSVNDIQHSIYTKIEQEEARQLIAKDEELKAVERSMNDQLRDIDIQSIQFDEKKKVWKDRNYRLQDQIHEQRVLHPYLNQLEIDFWPEFYHMLKNIIRLYYNKKELESEFEAAKQKQLDYSNQVSHILPSKLSQTNVETTEQKLAVLEQRYSNLEKQQTRYTQLKHFISENQTRQQQLKYNLATYQEEKTKLFDIADVIDEESFYQKASNIEHVQQLKSSKNKITEQFSTIFTTGEWSNLINDMPQQGTLELKIQDLQTNIEYTDDQLDQTRQNIADISTDLAKLETSEAYSELLYQMDFERNELRDLSKKWAVLKTAKEILTETKWWYRDKYLSQVINRTTFYFRELTNHQYTKIYISDQNNSFLIEAHDSIRYKVNELSQATVNQLYISLRLAISEVMNDKHHFPFIIDDAFVHFDGVRIKRILGILKEQANKQQFIIFTCKEEVADCFESTNIIDLNKNVSRV